MLENNSLKILTNEQNVLFLEDLNSNFKTDEEKLEIQRKVSSWKTHL